MYRFQYIDYTSKIAKSQQKGKYLSEKMLHSMLTFHEILYIIKLYMSRKELYVYKII